MKIKIPVTIGRNRVRGNSTGAMIDDEPGEDNLIRLRNVLREEAHSGGVTPTPEWLMNSVRSLLRMFEDAQAEYQRTKGDTIGHVFEAALPSGRSLLFGDRRVLLRLAA